MGRRIARRSLDKRPRAPLPHGPITGRRSRFRRAVSMSTAWVNRVLDLLTPGRLWHWMLHRRLEWSRINVPMLRAGSDLEGLKIAFLSDIHAGSFLNEQDLARLFERVANEQPDMVILGGDLINTREREILMFRNPLKLIDPPLGVFAVAGNHDHFWGRDIGLWTAFLSELGVEILMNRGVRVSRGEDGLWIAGIDDLTEGSPDLPAAMTGARDDEPVILVSHHPDLFFEAAAVGIDLTLSGHTHGGQIKLLGWAPIKHSRFGWNEGLFEVEGARLYVSRGVGVTFLPLRIGVAPEVPLLTLRCDPSQ